MAHSRLVIALGSILAALPASVAAQFPDPPLTVADGTDSTRYCMHVEAYTGVVAQTTRCWTRQEWADQGVDVDKEYPKEGVAVIRS